MRVKEETVLTDKSFFKQGQLPLTVRFCRPESVSTHQVINLIGQLYFLVCILQRFIIVLKENGKWSNGLHSYSTFPTSGHSKRFTILPSIHPFMHTFTYQCQPCMEIASSLAVRLNCLAQGHLDTQSRLGGSGDQTSNLPVTSQPALPPEPHAAWEKLVD